MKNIKKACIAIVMVVAMVSVLLIPAGAVNVEQDEIVAYGIFEGDVYDFTSIDDAIETGKLFSTPHIYVVGKANLSTSTDIPSDMTLVIATSEDYTKDTKDGNNVNEVAPDPQGAFATLTIPSGVTLTVAGTLIVAGNQQGHRPQSGYLTGKYGAIDLQGNLDVTGTLYARGEIGGSGTVTVKSEGKVYQRFEIADWRGGTVALSAYTSGVFPFSLYQLGGISAKTIYKKGSFLYGVAYIFASGSGHPQEVNILGNSTSDKSLIYFSGDETETDSDVTMANGTLTVNGTVATNNLSVTVNVEYHGIPISYPVSTSGKECPFGYNLNLAVSEKGSLTINNLIKFLPGCKVDVQSGGELTVGTGGGMYFYTADAYLADFNGAGWTSDEDATLIHGGTVTVNNIIANSSTDFINVQGFQAATKTDGTYDTVGVREYSTSLQTVTFYKGIPVPTPAE